MFCLMTAGWQKITEGDIVIKLTGLYHTDK